MVVCSSKRNKFVIYRRMFINYHVCGASLRWEASIKSDCFEWPRGRVLEPNKFGTSSSTIEKSLLVLAKQFFYLVAEKRFAST